MTEVLAEAIIIVVVVIIVEGILLGCSGLMLDRLSTEGREKGAREAERAAPLPTKT